MPSEKKTIRSPGASRQRELLVLGVREQSQRKAFRLNGVTSIASVRLSAVAVTKSGCTDPALAICKVWFESSQTRHQHGHVLGVELSFLELVVERSQHRRRRQMLRCQRAENSTDQRSIERGRSSLAADVAYGESYASRAIVEEVVEISADRSGRQEAGRDLGALAAWVGARASAEAGPCAPSRGRAPCAVLPRGCVGRVAHWRWRWRSARPECDKVRMWSSL